MVMSLVKVNDEDRSKVYSAFADEKNSIVVDLLQITSDFVSNIKTDFDLLVKLCLIFVTIALILAFGRIETGIIASIPMFVSWLWTLGFMGVFGIKFNIFNIIVSTFVFGLGVDYSILMMRGLLLEYKYGLKELSSYKVSIFLSSFTTVVGVGVLILARHPSLNSIALVSVIGLVSVVFISYTLEPVLFNWLVSKNGRKRDLPVTLADVFITIAALSTGLIFCILFTIYFSLILLLPIPSKEKKIFLHNGLFIFTKIWVFGLVNIKKKTINETREDFKTPSVIISNHQSYFDITLLLMQSPKIIILTSGMDRNKKLYSRFIRFLGFYFFSEDVESLTEKLRMKYRRGIFITGSS